MLLVTTLTALPLASCVTLGGGTDVRYLDTTCEAFVPITYSSRDTAETITEVRAHTRVFDAICAEPAE